MTRFPTAAHLASWAKFAPAVKESAGKKKGRGSTGHGNSYLARILGNCATAAGKTTPSSVNATAASPAAGARRKRSSRWDVRSWW
jgi:transposase